MNKVKMKYFVAILVAMLGLFTTIVAKAKETVSRESETIPKILSRTLREPPSELPRPPLRQVSWSTRESVVVEGGGTNIVVYQVISVQRVCGIPCAVSYPMESDQKYPIVIEYLENPRVLNKFRLQFKYSNILTDLRMVESAELLYDATEVPEKQIILRGYIHLGWLVYTGPNMFQIFPEDKQTMRHRFGLED